MGKPFTLYRCILIDGEQSEAVADVDATDDADALLKSEVLLVERAYDSLELWLENKMVGITHMSIGLPTIRMNYGFSSRALLAVLLSSP